MDWLIGVETGRLLGAHRTPQGSFALCESEATATNVLSVRKRSDSNKCFICAKAKRQQQMFYLCESEATATNVLSARKRSVSGKAPSRNGNQSLVLPKSHTLFNMTH
ncbi:hypothetical protein FJQ98_20145 [Lysinibacillus agricola]|uniref:Uncharacterized protein n=1 Tax=Lysinibacillus agricola TaxID=2590012 RepID=A0ABX7ANZ7_9BACI|nr:hypothetical protein [Lysinibacillus agricola]QQP11489.1 hypothetical protein FJQ98_20145 [Lysinibacillus agricola]